MLRPDGFSFSYKKKPNPEATTAALNPEAPPMTMTTTTHTIRSKELTKSECVYFLDDGHDLPPSTFLSIRIEPTVKNGLGGEGGPKNSYLQSLKPGVSNVNRSDIFKRNKTYIVFQFDSNTELEQVVEKMCSLKIKPQKLERDKKDVYCRAISDSMMLKK